MSSDCRASPCPRAALRKGSQSGYRLLAGLLRSALFWRRQKSSSKLWVGGPDRRSSNTVLRNRARSAKPHEINTRLVRSFPPEFRVIWWIAFLVFGSTREFFSKRQREIAE